MEVELNRLPELEFKKKTKQKILGKKRKLESFKNGKYQVTRRTVNRIKI